MKRSQFSEERKNHYRSESSPDQLPPPTDQSERVHAIDNVLKLKGQQLQDQQNAAVGSLLFATMEKTLNDKFQMLYDCFFKIIRDRLSNLQSNHKGQIDEMMYAEDSMCYQLAPQSKKNLKSLALKRAQWLEDYLYLPSHITFNQRAEILNKYGSEATRIEKDFKITAKKLAEQCQSEIYTKLPDLEVMISMLEKYAEPEVVVDKGLFTVFRQIQMEEEIEKSERDFQQSQRVSQQASQRQSNQNSGQSSTNLLQTLVDGVKKRSSGDLSEVNEKNQTGRRESTVIRDKHYQEQISKIRLHEIFQQRMLDTANIVNEYDQDVIEKLNAKIDSQSKDYDLLKNMQKTKNTKIRDLEEENKFKADKLRGFDDMKRKYEDVLVRLEASEKEVRKLKLQKKDMSKTFNKEIQANKVQHVAKLKQNNEKFVNKQTSIQITFFDQLSGVDEESIELLNYKLEDLRQQAHEKIATLIQENERKETQIHRYKTLAPEMYSLAQYEVEEIVKNLPVVTDDIDKLWNLLLVAFGEDCFTPNIVRKFPAQFTGDTKSQKEQLKQVQDSFNTQISEFEASVKAQLQSSNAELQIYINDAQMQEKLYYSVKCANEELTIRLDSRNKEFVEYRKSVNADIFKDWDAQQHIEFQVQKIQSRYESALEKYRLTVQELAEKNNKLKNQMKSEKVQDTMSLNVKPLEIRIKVLEQALAQNELLTAELFKDKDRVMACMKRDAPKLYRQFQTDVFTELSVYKKRVLDDMHGKLIKCSARMRSMNTCDKQEGTKIQDTRNAVKSFKVDEFGRELNLGLPKVQYGEAQTEIVEKVEEEPVVEPLKDPSEESLKQLVQKVVITPSQQQVKVSKPKVATASKNVQCDILKQEKKPVEAVQYELSGDYMQNLLDKMNEPDPRDLSYLNKELKTFEKTERDLKNKVNEAALSQKKNSTGTIQDIPVVFDRLTYHGQAYHKIHNELRDSLQQAPGTAFKVQQQNDVVLVDPMLNQISPQANSAHKLLLTDKFRKGELSCSTAVQNKSTKLQSLMTSTLGSIQNGLTAAQSAVKKDSLIYEQQLNMAGLFAPIVAKNKAFGLDQRSQSRQKRFSSPGQTTHHVQQQRARKAKNMIHRAWSSKQGVRGVNNRRQRTDMSTHDDNLILFGSDVGVKEFADYFKSMNSSMPRQKELEITENQIQNNQMIQDGLNTPKSNKINIIKKNLHQDQSEPATLIGNISNEALSPAALYGDTQERTGEDQNLEKDFLENESPSGRNATELKVPHMQIHIYDNQKDKMRKSVEGAEFKLDTTSTPDGADRGGRKTKSIDLPKASFLSKNTEQVSANYKHLQMISGQKVMQKNVAARKQYIAKSSHKNHIRQSMEFNQHHGVNESTMKVINGYKSVNRFNDFTHDNRRLTTQVTYHDNNGLSNQSNDYRSRTALGGRRAKAQKAAYQKDDYYTGADQRLVGQDSQNSITDFNIELRQQQSSNHSPETTNFTNQRKSTAHSRQYRLKRRMTNNSTQKGSSSLGRKNDRLLSAYPMSSHQAISSSIQSVQVLNPDSFVCAMQQQSQQHIIPKKQHTETGQQSQVLLLNQQKQQSQNSSIEQVIAQRSYKNVVKESEVL